MAVVAADAPDEVLVGLPERMDGALAPLSRTQGLQGSRQREVRLGHADGRKTGRRSNRLGLNAKAGAHRVADLLNLGVRQSFPFVAPTPEFPCALCFRECRHQAPRCLEDRSSLAAAPSGRAAFMTRAYHHIEFSPEKVR